MLLESAAPLLVVASLLVVNGVVVPVAEEWLWRGLIQPRLTLGLGLVMGVLAARHDWRASAFAHSVANLVATSIGLVVGNGLG